MPANCLLVSGGAVAFEEDTTSPHLSLDRESRSIKRSGRIAWANIDAAIAECYPAAPTILGVHPTANWLYVDSVTMTPWQPDPAQSSITVSSGVASYQYAQLEITYSRLPFDQESDGSGGTDFLTRKWSFGAEMLTMPASKLRWDNGAVPNEVKHEDVTAGKMIPTIELAALRGKRESASSVMT